MQLSLPFDAPTTDHILGIFERIKECKSLPILSPLASRILKICQKDETNASQLAELISQDPGMVAQILYIANSAYYGGTRHKVTKVVEAVNLLGFSRIANLALSFCFYRLIKDIKDKAKSGMDHVKFWRRSILASVAGRSLGRHFSFPDTDLIFLGSLLQDIGILALQEVVPQEFAALSEQGPCSHATLQMRELEHLGVDHPQVGAWLAQHWQLPEEFQMAILYSHTPEFFETPTELRYLIDSVALSGIIADIWSNPDTDEALAYAKDNTLVQQSIQPDDWEPILTSIVQDLPQIASFFQTKLGPMEDLHHIHQLALKELAAQEPSPIS